MVFKLWLLIEGVTLYNADMEIIEFFACADADRQYWLKEIGKSDWGAGIYLYELLRDGKLRQLCGQATQVLMLTDGRNLVSFCTYAPQDDIPAPEITPWLGFVYTFPTYRGKRMFGRLVEHAVKLAKADSFEHIYVSTLEIGLYEKYGFTFMQMMTDIHGGPSRVYSRNV